MRSGYSRSRIFYSSPQAVEDRIITIPHVARELQKKGKFLHSQRIDLVLCTTFNKWLHSKEMNISGSVFYISRLHCAWWCETEECEV